MSQHDYVIDNQDGASFRADINAALAAAVGLNSGPTEPTTTYPFMLWQDTTAGVLKQRNAANSAWVLLLDAIAAAPSSRLLTPMTAQATTSGTSKDFTGIPSWAKRITIMLAGFSTNGAGTSAPQVQLGTSGGLETTGYLSAASVTLTSNTTGATSSTTGLLVTTGLANATVINGSLVLTKLDGNTWVSSGALGSQNAAASYSAGGSKTLSGVLDRIRFTTVNGTDAFDAGSVNVLYE